MDNLPVLHELIKNGFSIIVSSDNNCCKTRCYASSFQAAPQKKNENKTAKTQYVNVRFMTALEIGGTNDGLTALIMRQGKTKSLQHAAIYGVTQGFGSERLRNVKTFNDYKCLRKYFPNLLVAPAN